MLRYSLLCVLFFTAAGQAHASWGDSLFDEHNRDFGAVPHGQIQTHPFRLVNNTSQTVVISNVRVSCGCTAARALQTVVAPGQETAIVAKMDTGRFFGDRTVTIFVQFSQPQFDEVRLTVKANSRDDVSYSSESLNFGKIKQGATPAATMTVSFTGSMLGKITDIKCDSNYIQPEVQELRNLGGMVTYKVSAKIRDDAPVGKWYSDVWLTTSNASMKQLRIPVNVEIESTSSAASVEAAPVAPANLVALGEVKAGTQTDRKVVLRAKQPFRIIGVSGTDAEVAIRTVEADSQLVHVLTVTLRPTEVGELTRTIRVQTDIPNNSSIDFNASAKIVP